MAIVNRVSLSTVGLAATLEDSFADVITEGVFFILLTILAEILAVTIIASRTSLRV